MYAFAAKLPIVPCWFMHCTGFSICFALMKESFDAAGEESFARIPFDFFLGEECSHHKHGEEGIKSIVIMF